MIKQAVKFQRKGHKLARFLAKNKHTQKKIIAFCEVLSHQKLGIILENKVL
jgi:hypothetical protein